MVPLVLTYKVFCWPYQLSAFTPLVFSCSAVLPPDEVLDLGSLTIASLLQQPVFADSQLPT